MRDISVSPIGIYSQRFISLIPPPISSSDGDLKVGDILEKRLEGKRTEKILEPVELGEEMNGFYESELIFRKTGEVGMFVAVGSEAGWMAFMVIYVRDGSWWEVVGFEVDASTCLEKGDVKLSAAGKTGAGIVGVGIEVCIWDWGWSEHVGED